MIDTLGDIGFVGAALGAVAFVITYSFFSPWWRHPAGRYIWMFSAVITVIMVLASVSMMFGPFPLLNYLRGFLFAALAAVIWGAEIALIRIQVWKKIRAKFWS